MARIRTIKPEFWTDAKVVNLPYEARLLFIGLWNFSDDDGWISHEPEQIKLQILPNDPVDCDGLLDLLDAAGMVEKYDLEDGRSALFIPGFSRHQKVSHKTSTKLPIATAKKRSIPGGVRRQVAQKYKCQPGKTLEANCYYCGAKGNIHWWTLSNGRPSQWVSFSGLELDHFIPEFSGGLNVEKNIVLSCRYCNRSKNTKDGLEFLFDKLQTSLEFTGTLRPEGKGIEGKGREGKGGASPESPPAAAAQSDNGDTTIPDGCETPRPFTGPSAEALAIVAAFDAAIERHHGSELARLCPAALDLVTAQRWLDTGASQALCEMVFEGVMQRMAAKGKRPLKSLKALDEDISDAIAAAAKPLPQGRQQGQPQGGAMSTGMPMPVHKPDPALLAKGRDRQVGHYRDGGKWNPDFGPAPDDFGPDGVSRCLADPNELAKHGYGPRNPKPAQGASP